MNTKLIVITSILCLPMGMAFAAMQSTDTMDEDVGTSMDTRPMNHDYESTIKAKDHINRSNDSTQNKINRMEQKGTGTVPNDVPVNKTPNNVPIKQPSDMGTHPSSTY